MDKTDPPLLLPEGAERNKERYSLILAESTMPTKGNELTDLARAEIGSDFILDTERPKANRLQRLIFIVIMALTLFLLYHHFPRPSVPVELKNEISFGELSHSYEKRFKKNIEEAQTARDDARYHESVKILQPDIDKLLADGLRAKDVRQNQYLFALYLDSVLQIKRISPHKENQTLQENAQKLVREIIKNDPDVVQWRLLEIDLCFGSQLFDWKARAVHDPEMVKQIDEVMKKLSGTRILLEKAKLEPESKRDKLAMLDFRRVQLLISKWKCAAEKLSDDDYGSPGVEYREEAWEIAARYDDVVDFLKLRKYIVDTIYNNNFGYYYWRGEKLWRKKFLKQESEHLKKKIEDVEKKRKDKEK